MNKMIKMFGSCTEDKTFSPAPSCEYLYVVTGLRGRRFEKLSGSKSTILWWYDNLKIEIKF